LSGLLIGRAITGASVRLAAGTAIAYLVELRLRADPKASVVRSRTIGTSVTIGALGVGPIAGALIGAGLWCPLQGDLRDRAGGKPARGLSITGRRNEMLSYFVAVRAQEVVSWVSA
jgi:hypothetical protein